jgi:hypothetical protein
MTSGCPALADASGRGVGGGGDAGEGPGAAEVGGGAEAAAVVEGAAVVEVDVPPGDVAAPAGGVRSR